MKPFIVVLAIFALLVSPAFNSNAQVPLNWTRDEINPGEDFTLIPDESFFTEGDKSCHMQLNTGAVPYLKSDVFYITPGSVYEFSCDVFDNDTAGQVKIYADFYDTYGFNIFGQPPEFSADSPEWQTISWQGTVPVQAVVGYVLVKFYNQPDLYTFNQTAHIWLDNFQFREAGGVNIIANGGLEEWQVGVEEMQWGQRMISVYPNPACATVNIKVVDGAETVSIVDFTGRELQKSKIGGKRVVSFDVSQLPKGIYLVKVMLRNNITKVQKLLIE